MCLIPIYWLIGYLANFIATSCSLLQQAADKTLINQLQQDLAAHRTQIDILKTNLEQSAAGFDKKCHDLI